MTTEQTITIHHEPPPSEKTQSLTSLETYNATLHKWVREYAHIVHAYWGTTYIAWYDPQVGEPVKPRRYVVRSNLRGKYDVLQTDQWHFVARNMKQNKQHTNDIHSTAARMRHNNNLSEDGMRDEGTTTGDIIKLSIAGFVLIGLVLSGALYGCPTYNVWQQQKEGEAELSRAVQNRNIKVLEAKAKQESAEYESQAEIIRARGAAKANQIIDSSLTVQYLHYLWVQGLREGKNEVIYVPTEGSIPIMEANRFNNR